MCVGRRGAGAIKKILRTQVNDRKRPERRMEGKMVGFLAAVIVVILVTWAVLSIILAMSLGLIIPKMIASPTLIRARLAIA